MLRKSLAVLSGAAIISSLGATFTSPSYAQSGPFSCDTTNLTTVFGSGRAVVMRWRTNEFASSGYNNVRRCIEVSSRFNQVYSRGQLNYITAGIVNGLPVVCAAAPGSYCDSTNVLFTLNRANSRKVADILQKLFDNRAGAAGAVVNESTDRIYIDVNKVLNELNVNGNTSNTTTEEPSNNDTNTRPTTNNTRPSKGGWGQ